MTPQRSAPDGSARPVRIVRAARDAPGRLTLACSQTSAPAGYTITCLAHLDGETLAAASVQVADEESGERKVDLLRGECGDCPLAVRAPTPNGGLEDVETGEVPGRVSDIVDFAQGLLERSGAGGEHLFEILVPEGERPEPRKSRREQKKARGVSRRDLLFGGLREADEDHDPTLSVPGPTPQRSVLLAALPQAIVDHPVASPGCTGCRICEQVCPEKAFGWSGVGGNGLLWVSPADCTACGICVQACPEDVLDLQPVTPADSAHQLARIQPRGCTKCGRGLVPGETEVCTVCSSRRNLLDDVWKHLGG